MEQTVPARTISDSALRPEGSESEPALDEKDAEVLRRVRPENAYVEFSKSEVEQSIVGRFEKQVTLHRDRLAVKTPEHHLTYDALNRLANRIGREVERRTKPDAEPVALLLDHGAVLIAAILAVLKSGNFYVALEPSHPRERLRHILEDAQPALLITDTKRLALAHHISSEVCSVLDLDALDAGLSDENLGLIIPPSALAYIVYTSGSIGRPKGVCQTHRNVLHCISQYTNACHLCASDRFSLLTLCCFAASMPNLFGALLNGGALLPFKVKEEGVMILCQWLRSEGISVYHSVPLVFRNLVLALTDHNGFPELRLVKLGGETITRKDVELFQSHFSERCLLSVGLGASEVNIIRHFLIGRQTKCPGQIVPVGFAVDEVEVLLLDESQREVPPGEMGEIAVRSSYLFTGYWRKPELTDAAFLPDPRGSRTRLFRTGDLGRMLPGGFLLHLGRKDFQVKIRGVRIEPAEVEMAMREFSEVRECVVVARKDELGDSLLAAYLVPQAAEKPEASTLRARLAEKLPNDWIPSWFVWLPELPLTPNGKVDRKALPALERTPGDIDGPQTVLEMRLLRIWQRLFGRDDIGRNDSFFAIGGYSLLATRLVGEIEKLLGHKLPIAALLHSPTIESLARRLTDENWAPAWTSLVPLQPQGSRPPLFLAHGWGGDLYWFVEPGNLFAPEQPVYGLQAVGLDGKSPRHTRVEDMAAHYVREIRAFSPEGPYYLGGYSLGGIIAYEMAQQLHRLGQHVAFLGLLDTSPKATPWPVYAWAFAPYLWSRLRFHLQRSWQMSNRERRAYLQRRWANLRWWITRNRSKPSAFANSPVEGSQPAQVPGFKDYYQAAASSYRLSRYAGSIDLFLSDSADPRLVSLWRNLARGGAVVHRVPGDHQQMIAPRNYPALVRTLRTALERAQAGQHCTLH